MRRLALGALALLMAACGGGEQTEGGESAFVPPPPPDAESFVPADTFDFIPVPDSLLTDSLAMEDSTAVVQGPSTPPPSFEPFLQSFKQALQSGDRLTMRTSSSTPILWALIIGPTAQCRFIGRIRTKGLIGY